MDGLHEKNRLEQATREINPVLASVGVAFKKMLATFGRDVGISPPKYFVLHMIAQEDGVSQGEIGRLFGVDPSRITRLAKVLEEEGLIERARDVKDNRMVRMYLTPEGKQVLDVASRKSEVFEERVRGVLGGDGIAELERMLGAVTEAMED